MDEEKATIDELRTLMKLDELDRTIRFASLRCRSPNEIIECIATLDAESDVSGYIHRLSEIELSDSELAHLVDAMNSLADRSASAPSKIRAKLDRTLLRLVRLLPSDLANRFAERFVDHHRKARRQWSYAALREKQISQSIAMKLLKVFHDTGDQEALQLIARNPERVPEIGADVLLENLDEEYWRARVIEALLIHDRSTALLVALQYPIEFAHAAGRVEDKSLLAPLQELFDDCCNELEFVSMYAYALGKLGGKRQLEALEKYISEVFGGLRERSGWCVTRQ